MYKQKPALFLVSSFICWKFHTSIQRWTFELDRDSLGLQARDIDYRITDAIKHSPGYQHRRYHPPVICTFFFSFFLFSLSRFRFRRTELASIEKKRKKKNLQARQFRGNAIDPRSPPPKFHDPIPCACVRACFCVCVCVCVCQRWSSMH